VCAQSPGFARRSSASRIRSKSSCLNSWRGCHGSIPVPVSAIQLGKGPDVQSESPCERGDVVEPHDEVVGAKPQEVASRKRVLFGVPVVLGDRSNVLVLILHRQRGYRQAAGMHGVAECRFRQKAIPEGASRLSIRWSPSRTAAPRAGSRCAGGEGDVVVEASIVP
jgi:hypothetical protein